MSQTFAGCTVLWVHSGFKAHTNSLDSCLKFKSDLGDVSEPHLSPLVRLTCLVQGLPFESPDPKQFKCADKGGGIRR